MRDKLDWDYWSDDLSVGIPGIDGDHRGILDLIARLHGAFDAPDADSTVRDALARIAEYAERHFQREESMLERAGYAFLAQHRQRHDTFRAYVTAFSNQDVPLPQLGELLSWLVDWWVGHIGSEDKLYRAHLPAEAAAWVDMDGKPA